MKAKKTSINHLKDVPHSTWTDSSVLDVRGRARYTAPSDNEPIDFIFAPKAETGRLIVFFSGNAKRSQFDPPVFQRWSWASKFPASCLYFSDPALCNSDDLGLAWYAGGTSQDHLTTIWRIVTSITEKLDVAADHVFSYASSGGGLAALRSAAYFPGLRPIAINPRTSLWRQPAKWISRFTQACYGVDGLRDVDEKHWSKFTAFDDRILAGASSIFLAQNDIDTLYLKNQYTPFVEYALSSPYASKLKTRVFSNEGGHAAAEDQATFRDILGYIEEVA